MNGTCIYYEKTRRYNVHAQEKLEVRPGLMSAPQSFAVFFLTRHLKTNLLQGAPLLIVKMIGRVIQGVVRGFRKTPFLGHKWHKSMTSLKPGGVKGKLVAVCLNDNG